MSTISRLVRPVFTKATKTLLRDANPVRPKTGPYQSILKKTPQDYYGPASKFDQSTKFDQRKLNPRAHFNVDAKKTASPLPTTTTRPIASQSRATSNKAFRPFQQLCKTYSIRMTQFTHQYFRSHPDSHQWSDVLEALGTYKNFKVLHSVKNPLLELQPISTLADSIGKERYALYLRLGEGNRYKLMLWADQDIEQSKNVTPHIQAVIDKLEKYIQQNPQIQNPALDSGVPIDYLSSQKVRKQFKQNPALLFSLSYGDVISQQAKKHILDHQDHYQAVINILRNTGVYDLITVHHANARICLLRDGSLALVRPWYRPWRIPTDYEALNNRQVQTLAQSKARASKEFKQMINQLNKDITWRDDGIKHDQHGEPTCIREADGTVIGTPFGWAWIK